MNYFIAVNGQQLGPFALEDLAAQGITAQTLVWHEGMTGWAPASTLPELASILVASPEATQYQQPQQVYQQPQQPYQQPQQAFQQPQQPPYMGQGYNQQPPMPQPETIGFMDALKICFSKYADFSGRARRSEFWWFVLWYMILSICTCGIGMLVLLIPYYAAGTRRLHDTGHSGWWIVGGLVFSVIVNFLSFLTNPALNGSGNFSGGLFAVYSILAIVCLIYSIAVFVFLVSDSTPGVNQYGPCPKNM